MDYVQHVREKLLTDEAKVVFDLYVSEARLPEALALSINSTAEGMATKGFGWHRASVALVEMAACGMRFNAAIYRGFCQRVPEAPVYDSKAEEIAARLVSLIQVCHLQDAKDADDAHARIRAFDANADTPEIWTALCTINPTSPEFRGITDGKTAVLYAMEKLNGR